MDLLTNQKEVCTKYKSPFVEAPRNLKIGISINVKDVTYPINGMRHRPENGTTGWYIWAGDQFSNDPDFFIPLHVAHLSKWCPAVLKYLALAPGWRFLIGNNSYEDVWEDKSLLEV
jgi:hypothetical protein